MKISKASAHLKSAATILMRKHESYPFRVTKLCEMAGINRTTFYDNYPNVDELLKEVFKDYLRDLDEYAVSNFWCDSKDEYIVQVTQTLHKMKKDSTMFEIGLNEMYFGIYEKAVYEYYLEDIADTASDWKSRYSNLFQISGGLKVIGKWIEDGTPIPPEELAIYLADKRF